MNEIVPSTSNNDLDEILDRFSDLSKSIVESIETEYSDMEDMENFNLLTYGEYKENSYSNSNLDNIEIVGNQIVSHINEFINVQSPSIKSNKGNKETGNYYKCTKRKCTEIKYCKDEELNIIESSEDEGDHDMENCSCHLPKHLEYVVNVIEFKEMLIPLIKQLYKGNILDDFLIMLQLISKGILEANNITNTSN